VSAKLKLGILAAAAAAAAPALGQPLPDFGVMYNNDGDVVYQQANTSQNTLTLNNMLTQLSIPSLKTVMWSIGSGSDILNYPTRVANTFGWRTTPYDNQPDWITRVNYGRTYAQQNYDPTRVVGNRVKTMGKFFIPSYRMNDDHFVGDPYNYPLTGSFWLNNTDKTIGASPVAGYDYSNLLDFARPEVRSYRMAIIDEAIDRYADIMDGFELDFNRVQIFFKPGQAAANAQLITDMVTQVRQKLDQKELQTGRQMYLFARIPPAMHNSDWAGLQVGTWISNRLVDVVLPSQLQTLAHDMPITPFVNTATAAGSGTKVVPSLYPRTNLGHKFVSRPNSTSYTGPDNGRQADIEQLRAAASNYRYLGATNFQLYNFGLPLTSEWVNAASELNLTNPTIGKNRVFAVTPSYFTDPEDTFSNRKQIPDSVPIGSTKNYSMLVGDNIRTLIRERPSEVMLRIGFSNANATYPMTIQINGRTLHTGSLTTRYFPATLSASSDAPTGYLHVPVDDLRALMQGTNTISVSNTGTSVNARITDMQLGVFGATVPGAGQPIQSRREPQSSMLRRVYSDQSGAGINYTVNNRTNNGLTAGGGGVFVSGQATSPTANYNHVAGYAFDQAMYYPSVEGTLAALDYSFWLGKTSGSSPTSLASLMLVQDDQVFTLADRFSLENGGALTSQTIQAVGITAQDFLLETAAGDGWAPNPNVHPNFSAGGSPLFFGFMLSRAGNPAVNGNVMPQTDLDDLIITFTSAAPGWAINGSGDWNQNSNWTSGVPNGVDALANFGSAINTPQTVYTNTPVTVGTVRFDNPGSYQLAGQGSLGIDVSSGSGLIDVRAGNHKINLPLSVLDNTDIDTAAGSSLRISDPTTLAPGVVVNKNGPGVLTFESTLNASGPATLKINGGVANLDAANNDADLTVDVDPATLNVGADQRLGGLVLTAGGNVVRVGRTSSGAMSPAKLTVNSLTVTGGGPADVLDQSLAGNTVRVDGALSVQGGSRLRKQGAGVLRTRSLDIAAGAQLDLTGGRVIVDYSGASPLAAVAAKVASGYADGSWTGDGIVSSTAPADAGTGVGFAEASTLGVSSFGGEGVDGSSVLLRYTLRGDGNLDGSVNLSDFTALAAAFGGGSTWSGGDYNYDGVTNLSDFTALAANFGRTLPADPARAVPEPAAALAACVAGMMFYRVRRA